MTANEMKDKFDLVAKQLLEGLNALQEVYPHLVRDDDLCQCNRISIDLAWAIENCTVMGLHQIGKALDDHMGLGVVK